MTSPTSGSPTSRPTSTQTTTRSAATSTFFPSLDASLRRDPTNVHSVHAKSYAKGTVVEERAATATAFNGERGGTSSNSNIKRQTAASRAARRELRTHSTEDDVIECTIQVPPSAVNLVYQGWRLQAKFSHFATEGYGDWTWMRVLERTVKPMAVDAFAYEITLKLAPQEEGLGGGLRLRGDREPDDLSARLRA